MKSRNYERGEGHMRHPDVSVRALKRVQPLGPFGTHLTRSGAATGRETVPGACLLYQLLINYGETVEIGDIFASFCAARGGAVSAPEPPRRPKARRKPKRKLKTVEREGAEGKGGEDGCQARKHLPHS
jgi:hypothetical protein